MMNEESRLEPNLIIEQATEAIRILHEENSRLEASRAPMTAFIDDNTLFTRAINLLKQKMRDMRRIIDALILANLTDIRDYQKLIAIVSQVDGNINGRLTLLLLDQTVNNINFTGQRLDRARWNLNSLLAFPHLATTTDQALRNMIRQYERTLNDLYELQDHLNSRIDLFDDIEFESRILFREADELRDHAMSGFEMIHQASVGLPTSFSHPGLSQWRSTLETKKENLDDIRIAQAEGILTLLHEQGVSLPEEWTDEQRLEFAHRYLSEMRLLTAFMNENFPETDFGDNHRESLAFQRAEQIAWFFLADPQLSFTLTFEQRVELMNVMESNTMHGPVTAFFENLGFSDDDGGFLRLSEASSLASHATFVHKAAESGTTVDNWFASLAAIGIFEGVIKLGMLPRSIPQQAQQGRGQQDVSETATVPVFKPIKKPLAKTVTVTPEMRNKILWGEEKAKPREVRGGHSPDISANNPNNIKVTTLKVNSDGTKYVRFNTTLSNVVVSKKKRSTLFPSSWNSNDIIRAIEKIAKTKPIATRASDGSILHRGIINGVEINVIIHNGKITSGYPTGTKNAKPPGGFE